MRITPKLLRQWDACWHDDEIAEHFAGRRYVTPREVAEDESLSQADRLWVVTHALAHLDARAARLYAIECAASVTHLAGDEDDQAAHAGLLHDLIQIEMEVPWGASAAATRHAIWNAARDAIWNAAWDAVWSAAWDAAWNAAWDAVWSAAWDAAWNAARSAARDAATQTGLDDAIRRALEWLGEEADG
jgi:hypothetical protein